MPFECPACQTADSLRITHSIDLPPDARSDEIAVQTVECGRDACRFRGVAVYEESRRGALDAELWDHTGYRISAQAFDELLGLIERCPTPRNARCTCPVHAQLGAAQESGRWQGLPAGELQGAFPMRLKV